MRLRFSIRDLFWATLAVALVLGWWLHYRSIEANRRAVVQHAEKVRSVLTAAKAQCEQLERDADFYKTAALHGRFPRTYLRPMFDVDWAVLNEPIP
jgi:hypothetical protein